MKKIIYLLMAMLLFTVTATTVKAQAEFSRSRTATSTASLDTLTNTDTIYHTIKTPGTNYVTIQVDVKKVTGTIGGKAYLYGSASGTTNYVLLDSTASYSVGAWQQLSANTYSKVWTFAPSLYYSYKVATYSSGTVAETPKVYAILKPYYYSPR